MPTCGIGIQWKTQEEEPKPNNLGALEYRAQLHTFNNTEDAINGETWPLHLFSIILILIHLCISNNLIICKTKATYSLKKRIVATENVNTYLM